MTYARANELAAELEAAGMRVAVDPRSAVPPCVLFQPPTRTYDLAEGYSITWRLVVLAPGPGSADAWTSLDAQTDQLIELMGGPSDTTVTPVSYQLPTAAGEPVPAYIVTFTEGTE